MKPLSWMTMSLFSRKLEAGEVKMRLFELTLAMRMMFITAVVSTASFSCHSNAIQKSSHVTKAHYLSFNNLMNTNIARLSVRCWVWTL